MSLVKTFHYRSQLMAASAKLLSEYFLPTILQLSSALGCHNYHETSEAINEDEADIVRILQSVIDCDTDKETILRLRKDHAEYFWTLIRDVCFYEMPADV